MPLEYPLPQNDQKIIEKTDFQELHALTFRGGLPVFTAFRTGTMTQGEVWIEYLGGSASLYVYANGAKYKI
jgi:hypothetical protein